MARVSTHAKQRLYERFCLDQEGINIVGARGGVPHNYTLIKKINGAEIREVYYNGNKIQLVVKGNTVVTVLPAIHEIDHELDNEAQKRQDERTLKSKVCSLREELKRERERVKAIRKASFLMAIVYMIKIRKGEL